MRRGRTLSGLIALLAVIAFGAVVPSAFAGGGTPMDICQDLQDGRLDDTYTQDQLNAFFSDPTVQGYCGPITVIVAPPTPTVTPPTPTVTPPTTTVCAPGTVATTDSNGRTVCTTPPPAPTAPPAVPVPAAKGPVAPVQVGVSEVAGVQKTIASPKRASVKGVQHTVRVTPTKSSVAPISTTRARGTLPFTGAQLTLFLLVGLALVATGFVLRTTGRRRTQE